jgi:hypothetical protein
MGVLALFVCARASALLVRADSNVGDN